MSRNRRFALVGCGTIVAIFVLVVVLAVVVGMAADWGTKPERDAQAAEEKRQGLHCLTFGHHAGLMALVQQQLKDPDSLELDATRIGPAMPDSNGILGHSIVMEFRARNSFGGMVRNTARGWVDHETCAATLEWIR